MTILYIFGLYLFCCKTLPVWYRFQPIKSMNFVVPSPYEIEPYNNLLYYSRFLDFFQEETLQSNIIDHFQVNSCICFKTSHCLSSCKTIHSKMCSTGSLSSKSKSFSSDCVIPENIHTSPTEGIFLRPSTPGNSYPFCGWSTCTWVFPAFAHCFHLSLQFFF